MNLHKATTGIALIISLFLSFRVYKLSESGEITREEALSTRISAINSGLSLLEGNLKARMEEVSRLEKLLMQNLSKYDAVRGELNVVRLFIEKYQVEAVDQRIAKLAETANTAYVRVDGLFKNEDGVLNKLDLKYVSRAQLTEEVNQLRSELDSKTAAIEGIVKFVENFGKKK